MKQLEVNNLKVELGNKRILNDISFSLDAGKIGCLLGPSGCGKTTLLRSIAGFETPQSGDIYLHDKVVSKAGYAMPVEKRNVGMVFQDFALFPHLTIAKNIAFGIGKLNKSSQEDRVKELLNLVGLPDKGNQYPHELSGGQQQRVALARALAPRPEILLLDEPFSSMDTELREQLARTVRGILKEEGVTAILVTHDQMEAFAMADEIGVLDQGKMLQWDNAYQLYHEPKTPFVANFIGQGTFIKGNVKDARCIETVFGEVCLSNESIAADKKEVNVLIRPDDVIHDDDSELQAVVIEKAFRGAEFLYTLELNNKEQVLCYAPSHHNHKIGEAIGINVELDHLVYF